MQADYAKSRLPVRQKRLKIVVPAENLAEVYREYYLSDETVQVKMKDGKTLTLTILNSGDGN